MIDLTPLDVRNKRGDFTKGLRGYDPQEVDTFLELVAERLEQLVMENLRFTERVEGLQRQVDSQSGREQAVQEALVTAQELRSEVTGQARREADLVLAEARTEARRLVAEAEAEARTLLRDTERRMEEGRTALEEMERRRSRFLKAFRQLLERELDVCQVEEERAPLEDRPIDLDLGGGLARRASRAAVEEVAPAPDGGSGEAELPVEEPGVGAEEAAPAPSEGDAHAADVSTLAPDATAASAADEVREALAGLESAQGETDTETERETPTAGDEADETLSLSFDEAPASDEDDRWG